MSAKACFKAFESCSTSSYKEVENYYKEHLSDFVEKPRIKVRSMTLKKGDQAREKGLTDEAAMKKIEEFRKHVLSGEDFSRLATANSEDYQATQGGLSDWIEKPC